MSKPIFSILTPTYNCASFIRRSYHALISQTIEDWEWVIIDDGSSDNTKEIINSIEDNRIKFLTYEVNKGRGFARSYGLSECSGEIVVVWDVDDIYLPERLQNIYNEIIVEKYDFMVSKAIVVDNSFNIKGIRGFSDSRLFKGFVHPTLAFRRIIAEKIDYDKRMRAGEDLLLMILLSNNYSGKYLDKNLMLYFEDREVNLNKTIQMHESHTFTIHKVLNEDFLKISKLTSLKIKISLFIKKIALNIFRLKPSLYLKTVQFRNIAVLEDKDDDYLIKIVEKIKGEYSNL